MGACCNNPLDCIWPTDRLPFDSQLMNNLIVLGWQFISEWSREMFQHAGRGKVRKVTLKFTIHVFVYKSYKCFSPVSCRFDSYKGNQQKEIVKDFIHLFDFNGLLVLSQIYKKMERFSRKFGDVLLYITN